MLLTQFPDIQWVRQLKNDAARGGDEWRNVVLNFKVREASRLNLESPYSLFINRRGHSYCSAGRRKYRVETDAFLFTQPGDIYGLEIDNLDQTEICNIHINRNFFNGVARSLVATNEQLLDDPLADGDTDLHLFTQLYHKTPELHKLTHKLIDPDTYASGGFEAALTDVVAHLLITNTTVRRSIENLPFARATVRADIYDRLATARDYLYSNYNTNPNLDEVCREVGMSRFHFLRVFRSFYGMTPHQYLNIIRLEKGATMLKGTQASIADISDALGFEYPNSFIKAFRKVYNISPLQYRLRDNSNFG